MGQSTVCDVQCSCLSLVQPPNKCFFILCSVPYQIQGFKVIGIFCASMQSSTASKDRPGNEASFTWNPETSSSKSVLLVRGRVFHGKEAG